MPKFSWDEQEEFTIVIKFTDPDDTNNRTWGAQDAKQIKEFLETTFIGGKVTSIDFVEKTK